MIMMKILSDFLNLFFPRLCLLCRTPLVEGEKHICLRCLCDLPLTRFTEWSENQAAQLFTGKFPFTSATALFYYNKGGHVQLLIHSLKYHGNKELGYDLGRMAALELNKDDKYFFTPATENPIDIIIPIPLHPKRQRQRGYNQAEWIANGISSVTGIPVSTTAIYRTKPNESQTQKQVYERQRNVQDVFILASARELEGKHILLVDDVITTGSTMSACVETVLTLPGTRISLLGIALA